MTHIYKVEKPTQIDLRKLGQRRIVWIFDIDETLVTHDVGDKQEPIDPELPIWISEILINRPEDAICFLTARLDPTKIFPYNKKPERDLLRQLGITDNNTIEQLTLNQHVPLFTYTSGNLKGQDCLNIVNNYVKFGFQDFYFLDDRLTQIGSVKDVCGSKVTTFWISSFSQEIHLESKFPVIKDHHFLISSQIISIPVLTPLS